MRLNRFGTLTCMLICWLVCSHAWAELGELEWEVHALLPSNTALAANSFSAALASRLAEHERIIAVDPQDNLLVLRLLKGAVQISITPTAAPLPEALDACRRATWYWREGCDAVKQQRALALITMRGSELRKVESAVLLTKIVATLLQVTDANAVLWGHSLQSRDTFLKGSEGVSVRNIPALLWVDYQLRREPSGNVSIFTRGLKAFNVMELEAKDAPFAGHDLIELMLQTTQNLIARGPLLQDGESIGASSSRRIFVKHAESFANPGKRVYRIHFDG